MTEPNYYDETIDRMEPDIAAIDAGAYHASASISLRRISDALDKLVSAFYVAIAMFAGYLTAQLLARVL